MSKEWDDGDVTDKAKKKAQHTYDTPVKDKRKKTEGSASYPEMTEEEKASFTASDAKKQAYAKDKMSLTDKKSWSVSETDDGFFAVIDDSDGHVTSKWPTKDGADGQVHVLELEDEAGRSTT